MCNKECEHPVVFTLLILSGFQGTWGFWRWVTTSLTVATGKRLRTEEATHSCTWNMSDTPGVAHSSIKEALVAELVGCFFYGFMWQKVTGSGSVGACVSRRNKGVYSNYTLIMCSNGLRTVVSGIWCLWATCAQHRMYKEPRGMRGGCKSLYYEELFNWGGAIMGVPVVLLFGHIQELFVGRGSIYCGLICR